jgi:Mrp family chromosome partitioning ATPase
MHAMPEDAPHTQERWRGPAKAADPTAFETLGIEASGLLQAVASLKPTAAAPALVQIVGPEGGEGVSTIASELTRLISRKLSRRVVLVLADAGAPPAASGQARVDPGAGRRDVATLALHPAALVAEREGTLVAQLAEDAPGTEIFIIDSPPLNRSVEAFMISREVKGTVLVVDAERTLAGAADAARMAVERASGTVLGVVINRRRYRVPRPIAEAFGLGPGPSGLAYGRSAWLALAALVLLAVAALAVLAPEKFGLVEDPVEAGTEDPAILDEPAGAADQGEAADGAGGAREGGGATVEAPED